MLNSKLTHIGGVSLGAVGEVSICTALGLLYNGGWLFVRHLTGLTDSKCPHTTIAGSTASFTSLLASSKSADLEEGEIPARNMGGYKASTAARSPLGIIIRTICVLADLTTFYVSGHSFSLVVRNDTIAVRGLNTRMAYWGPTRWSRLVIEFSTWYAVKESAMLKSRVRGAAATVERLGASSGVPLCPFVRLLSHHDSGNFIYCARCATNPQ